tara:strand:- start:446 stop:736 length:291 start_codon:yes stop_codon:yes gene_type:complete
MRSTCGLKKWLTLASEHDKDPPKMVDFYCHDLLGVDVVQTNRHGTHGTGKPPVIAFLFYRLLWSTHSVWRFVADRLRTIVPVTVMTAILVGTVCSV